MPSAEVNSVMIRPHPPRFLMKRRKTVSVTPAIGASTVAGAMRTLPIFKLAGNVGAAPEMEDGATGAPPARAAAASVLSQNFCTPPFYSAYEPLPSCASLPYERESEHRKCDRWRHWNAVFPQSLVHPAAHWIRWDARPARQNR